LRQEGQDEVDGEQVARRLRLAGGVGTTNLYLKPGEVAPDALIAGIDRGFYLTVVLGLFAAIDSASGDFSIPWPGFMIEKGKKTFPRARASRSAANLFELLKAVDKVGSDLTWFQSTGSRPFR